MQDSDKKALGEDDVKAVLPVNLKRLIWNAQKIFHIEMGTPSDLHPVHIIRKVKELSERLVVFPGEDLLSRTTQENATLLFRIHLRATLASKRVLKVWVLVGSSFTLLLITFCRSIISILRPLTGFWAKLKRVLGCALLTRARWLERWYVVPVEWLHAWCDVFFVGCAVDW